MADLFPTITFEDGTLNGFDSTVGIGLAAIAPGLVASSWCMEVDITNINDRYGQIVSASDEDHVRLFFSLDPRTIDPLVMADGDVFTALLCQDAGTIGTFRVELGYTAAAGFRIRPALTTDVLNYAEGAWIDISANEHVVEIEWYRSTGFGMNNGSIEMWVDVYETDLFGVADSSRTGIDNDTRTARIYRLGAPQNLDAGTSGVLWVDHLAANNDGTPIGHPGTLAFPTAQGAGRYSVGGREGTVYKITNLNAAGAGSLHEACTAAGPRVVVFEVDGNIDGSIVVDNPYLSVYGQTAPGDGICIRNGTFRIRTHDVIIQHVRFRRGDDVDDTDSLALTAAPTSETDADGMVHDVIIDHCSISWALDENSECYNTQPARGWIKNITYQWCIISEGLDIDGHSMGLLFGATPHSECIKNASVHHCLFAHNGRRNPRLAAVSPIELVNNVNHDCPLYDIYCIYVDLFANHIGNTSVASSPNYVFLCEPDVGTNDPADYQDYQIYLVDNAGNYFVDDTWQVVGKGYGPLQGAGAAAFRNAWEAGTAAHIANSALTAEPRADAYANTLAMSGCFPRDPVDTRIVQEVVDGVERLIDSQLDVGGWPALTPGVAGADSDGDGMPDTWEIERGLDPNVPNSSGYDLSEFWTNIEVCAFGGGGVIPPERIRRIIVSMMV